MRYARPETLQTYLARLERRLANCEAALLECEDYFDRFADCDCDQDGTIPNEEMVLICTVREALQ